MHHIIPSLAIFLSAFNICFSRLISSNDFTVKSNSELLLVGLSLIYNMNTRVQLNNNLATQARTQETNANAYK